MLKTTRAVIFLCAIGRTIIIIRDVKFVYNCDKLVFHFMHPEYSIRGNEHIMIGPIIIMLLFLSRLMLLLDNETICCKKK